MDSPVLKKINYETTLTHVTIMKQLGGNPRLARGDGLKEIITLKLYRLIYWGILIIFYGNTFKRVSKDLYKFIMNLI